MRWFLALQMVALWRSVDASCDPPTPPLPSQLSLPHSFITPNYGIPDGHQVIFTGASFGCHGYIRSWGAVATYDIRYLALTHAMHLQVWRPGLNRTYYLVGMDSLVFLKAELVSGTLNMRPIEKNYRYFKFSQKPGNLITFQPGDVIGCFVPPFHESAGLRGVLSPLYETVGQGSMLVDVTPHPDNCELVDCGGSVQRLRGITPLISVDYVSVSDSSVRNTVPQVPLLPDCSMPGSKCCLSTAYQQTAALDDCYTSLSGELCSLHLPSTLHLQPSLNTTFGHQVLFPDITFSCHGYIDSWSAVTVFDAAYSILSHSVSLQVWRPIKMNHYKLVGSERLLVRLDLSNQHQIQGSNNSYIVFSNQRGTVTNNGIESDRIYFQPGDVIGYFSPARFRTLNPPLSVVYSSEGEGSRMFVGRSDSMSCDDDERVRGVEVGGKVVPWISVKTVSESVDVGIHTLNETLCEPGFYLTGLHQQSSVADTIRRPPTLTASHTPSPNMACADGMCNHATPTYGIFPILASTVILVVASFSLFLCSILFCHARKRHHHTPTHPTRHSITQPILPAAVSSRETSSDEDGRSASACALRAAPMYDRSRTVSTEFGLDDGASTRISNLLEFHAYPHHSTHHNSTYKVSEV